MFDDDDGFDHELANEVLKLNCPECGKEVKMERYWADFLIPYCKEHFPKEE